MLGALLSPFKDQARGVGTTLMAPACRCSVYSCRSHESAWALKAPKASLCWAALRRRVPFLAQLKGKPKGKPELWDVLRWSVSVSAPLSPFKQGTPILMPAQPMSVDELARASSRVFAVQTKRTTYTSRGMLFPSKTSCCCCFFLLFSFLAFL